MGLGASRKTKSNCGSRPFLRVATAYREPLSVNPMSKWKHPKNDGWTDVTYSLLSDPERNARLSDILNEACHVFHLHAEGVWRSDDKDSYSRLIAKEIRETPSLIRKLLGTEDRVIKMLTYRAIELNNNDHGEP